MIEPTRSEILLCDAISLQKKLRILQNVHSYEDSPCNAPHTAEVLTAEEWNKPIHANKLFL